MHLFAAPVQPGRTTAAVRNAGSAARMAAVDRTYPVDHIAAVHIAAAHIVDSVDRTAVVRTAARMAVVDRIDPLLHLHFRIVLVPHIDPPPQIQSSHDSGAPSQSRSWLGFEHQRLQ